MRIPYKLLIAGIVSLPLLLSSCDANADLEVQQDEIELSIQDSLVLSPTGGQEAINVSYEGEWFATSNADWLRINEVGRDLLILEADENPEVQERVAVVTIFGRSHGAQRDVTVKQEAGELKIDFLAGDTEDGNGTVILLDQWATEGKIIPLNISTKVWSVSTQSDWLQVQANTGASNLLITATENTERADRTAVITITSGDNSKDVTVKQSGILYYIEPIFEFGQAMNRITPYELERHSNLFLEPSAGQPALGVQPQPFFIFKTASPLFPEVRYQTMNYQDKFMYVSQLVGANDKAVNTEEFRTWMKEKGFKLNDRVLQNGRLAKDSGPEGTPANDPWIFDEYWESEERGIQATVHVNKYQEQGFIIYYPLVEQEQSTEPFADYSTYTELPLGMMSFNDVTIGDVRRYEESKHKGAVMDATLTSSFGAPTYHAESPMYLRTYFMDESQSPAKMIQYAVVLDQLHTVFFEWGALCYPTREFSDMMTKTGWIFVYYDFNTNTYIYYNMSKNVGVNISSFEWAEKKVVKYNVFPLS